MTEAGPGGRQERHPKASDGGPLRTVLIWPTHTQFKQRDWPGVTQNKEAS